MATTISNRHIYHMTKEEWTKYRGMVPESHWQDAPDLGDGMIIVTMNGPLAHNLEQVLGRKALTMDSPEMQGRELTHPLIIF